MTRAHHLKIKLKRVRRTISREFLVPSDLRLDRLHEVIQVVMGWRDCHLHEFSDGVRGLQALRFGPSKEVVDDDEDPLLRDERMATLAELAPVQGSKFCYWYDFGDDWLHEVTVNGLGEAKAGMPALACLKAIGACPPEDCGGPDGYMDMLDVLADPDHQDYKQVRKWLGGDFDPARYDLAAVNQKLMAMAARWQRPVRSSKAKRPAT